MLELAIMSGLVGHDTRSINDIPGKRMRLVQDEMDKIIEGYKSNWPAILQENIRYK